MKYFILEIIVALIDLSNTIKKTVMPTEIVEVTHTERKRHHDGPSKRKYTIAIKAIDMEADMKDGRIAFLKNKPLSKDGIFLFMV